MAFPIKLCFARITVLVYRKYILSGSLSAEDRPIGGLGIYLVKKTMDDVRYEFRDGQNILTLEKTF